MSVAILELRPLDGEDWEFQHVRCDCARCSRQEWASIGELRQRGWMCQIARVARSCRHDRAILAAAMEDLASRVYGWDENLTRQFGWVCPDCEQAGMTIHGHKVVAMVAGNKLLT